MKSSVVKRSIDIAGRKTSVSLEDPFWYGLRRIASDRGMTTGDLVATINTDRQNGNLSSTIRLFVLDYFRASARAYRRPRAHLHRPWRAGQNKTANTYVIDITF